MTRPFLSPQALTPNELRLLSIIKGAGLYAPLRILAVEYGSRIYNISKMIKRMERKGVVHRVHIHKEYDLTPAGYAALEK